MSDRNEQEKLTPASWKSYDGSRTSMAESDKDYEPYDEEGVDEETESSEDSVKEVKARDTSKLAEVLGALFALNQESNGEERDAVVKAFVEFVKEDNGNDPSSAESVEKVTDLLIIFATPEKITPHTSDEDLAEATTAMDLFDTILDAAEEAGFDKEVLSDELAKKAKDKDIVAEDDRFDKLEEYFKVQLAEASASTATSLREELAKVKDTTDAGSLLENILEEVEEYHDYAELAQQGLYNKQFAEIIGKEFKAVAESSLKHHEEKEDASLLDQEEKQAKLLMDILLSPKDKKGKKTDLFAAMLLDGIEGKSDQQDAALHQKLMRYAKHVGIDERDVLLAQQNLDEKYPPRESEQVNELESVPDETIFERMVGQQIDEASSEEVERIRKGWEAIKDTLEEGTFEYDQAEEAIYVLGKIIGLKQNQEAQPRDFNVSPHPLQSVDTKTAKEEEADTKDKDTQAVETQRELSALQETLETIGDKDLQNYFQALLKRMKKGMTAEQVSEELTALKKQLRTVIGNEQQLKVQDSRHVDLSQKIGSFTNFLTMSKDGIVATDTLGESEKELSERDPHEKPFTLVLETHHDDAETSNKLLAWRENILAEINDHPEGGKVLVLLEHGLITKEQSEAITEVISEGTALPSAALHVLSVKSGSKEYIKVRNQILDELSMKHPGRLHVVIEWKPEDYEGRYIPYIEDIKANGITDSALASLQEQIAEHVHLMKKRDTLMSHIVADTLEREDLNIIGGVGLLGTAHNPLGHQLEKMGYDVKHSFGDKNGGETFMNPFAAYVRSFAMFPDKKPSDDELRLVLRAELRLKSLRSKNPDEAALRKDIYKWMREERKKPEYAQAETLEFPEGINEAEFFAQLFSRQAVAAPDYPDVEQAAHAQRKSTRVPTSRMDDYGRRGPIEYYNPNLDLEPGFAMERTSKDLLEVMRPPTARDGMAAQELYKKISKASESEIYGKEMQLEAMQNQLNDMISEAIQSNNSDGMVSIHNIPQVREFAAAMMQQRNVLAKMKGYEGLIETQSDIKEPELYRGFIHDVLRERMRRIQVELGGATRKNGESYTNEQLAKYYSELQRWADIILDNDVRRNPANVDREDTLILSTQRYERYKDIVSREIKGDSENIGQNSRQMLDDIKYMLDEDTAIGGDFLRYFKKNAANAANRSEELGVLYQRPNDEGAYQPESLQATMKKIAKEFGHEYEVGGKKEFINAEGEFQYQNFVYWIRKKIAEDIDYNKDGGINPFGKIVVKLDMGQISMYELLLLIPQYTQQRRFEIYMKDGKENKVDSGWGQKVEDPNFAWADLDLIAMEMDFRQMTHELRVGFTDPQDSGSKDKYMQIMKKLHTNNHWTRANNVFLLLGYAAGSVENAKEEFDLWKNEETEQQGSLGKAMSDMLVAYNYLSEMTDYHEAFKPEFDEHGHPIKRKKGEKATKEEKTFNENMFYRFLEPNGANRFLIKMAEGALDQNNDAKHMFAEFIAERLDAAEAIYGASATPDQRRMIEQIKKEQLQAVATAKNDSIVAAAKGENKTEFINFTHNVQLDNFHTLVRKTVLKDKYKGSDKEINAGIAKTIRDELVDNLKVGYFEKLKNMQVGNIGKDSNGNDRRTSGRDLMVDDKEPTIAFNKIVLSTENGKDYTMGDLLNEFEVDQIFRFDYSNDEKGPFAQYHNDPKRLRYEIDKFMDPTHNSENYNLFRQNEKMMLAFTKHVARVSRKELNHFRDANENRAAKDMVKRGMMHVAEKNYGIDGAESLYAWWWARDYIYLWGIGASLDVEGIGFRWDGRLMNTGKWRPRRQGKDAGGNPHTFDEFLALSLPFLHHMQVTNHSYYDDDGKPDRLGHRSVFSWLQGGEGGDITPRAVRKFDKRSNYRFEENQEALYVANTLDSASEFIDLVAKTEFEMKKILATDNNGNTVYDYAEARKIFGEWRKAARYAFGKNGLDYREKIWVNGREKTLYEHFFGPKTRALNHLIYEETPRSEDFKYKDPADAIFMSIIAAEVAEHRSIIRSGHYWTIEDVLRLEQFLNDFLIESDRDEDEHGNITSSRKKKATLFNRKIFGSALKAYHTAYHKMYATEISASFFEGFFKGMGEGIKALFKGKWIW